MGAERNAMPTGLKGSRACQTPGGGRGPKQRNREENREQT